MCHPLSVVINGALTALWKKYREDNWEIALLICQRTSNDASVRYNCCTVYNFTSFVKSFSSLRTRNSYMCKISSGVEVLKCAIRLTFVSYKRDVLIATYTHSR